MAISSVTTYGNYIDLQASGSAPPAQNPAAEGAIFLSGSAGDAKFYFNSGLKAPKLKVGSGADVTTILDEDDLVSDSATALATQQSIKAYVDAQVTAQDLDFQGDTGGALSIDLDSETLDIAGGTGIDTAGSGNTLTVAIDSTVATLAGSQTLTNKTLTAPVLNGALSGTSFKDEDDMSSDSATAVASQQSIKKYVDDQDAAIASDTLTFTNKTFDANGSGNSLSNVEVADFAGSAIITESEGIGSNDNDTSLPTSAAVKDYVDATVAGVDIKDSVVVATTAAIANVTYNNGAGTITSNANTALTVDGVTMSTQNERILVKDQSAAETNGVYTLTTVGDGSTPFVLTRATDFDAASEFLGAPFFMVEKGSANGAHGFVCSNASAVTLGTTDITFYQFSAPGQDSVAGLGLAKSGNVLAVDLNEFSAAVVDVANDSIAIIDANDSNAPKKEAISDLVGAVAGTVTATGLAASNGVMGIAIHSLDAETIASGDKIAFSDATDNGLHHETIDDVAALFAGAGLGASSAVISVANATNGGLAVNANDMQVDLNDLSAASVDVANDSIAIIDANDSNASKKESIVDLVAGIAGSGLSAASGQLSADLATLIDSDGANRVITSDGDGTLTAEANLTCNGTTVTVGADLAVRNNAGSADLLFADKSLDKVIISGSLGLSNLGVGEFPMSRGGLLQTSPISVNSIADMVIKPSTNPASPAGDARMVLSGSLQVESNSMAAGQYAIDVANTRGNDSRSRVRANAFVTYSARELKKDIKDISNPMAKLNALRPVTYNWRGGDTKSKGWNSEEVGFIADEVQQVLPQIVQTGLDGKAQGIDYSKLTAVLTQAVKVQDQEIQDLKAQLSQVLKALELKG